MSSAIDWYQVKVAQHRVSLGEDLTADPSRGSQDLDPSQFARDQGLVGALSQPVTQSRRLILESDQLHQR